MTNCHMQRPDTQKYFGEEIPSSIGGRTTALGYAGNDGVRQKFTGKERDSETGLDYFGARYFSGAQGRWMSPDVINLSEARLLNPSIALNKYAYGANNTLKFTDPDGLDVTLFYRPVENPFDINDWGHVFLAAFNQDTGEVQFLDFYPSAGGLSGFPPKGQGEFNNGALEERRGAYASLTVQTTPEIAQKVIDEIKKLKAQPQTYSFPNRTCTTLCKIALDVAGMRLSGITPQGMWENFTAKYASRGNNFTLPGKLSMLPVTRGYDYGAPRNGNPWSWQSYLFRLWQEQRPKQACVSITGSDGKPSTKCEPY